MTYQAIADELDLPRTTVRRIIVQNGKIADKDIPAEPLENAAVKAMLKKRRPKPKEIKAPVEQGEPPVESEVIEPAESVNNETQDIPKHIADETPDEAADAAEKNEEINDDQHSDGQPEEATLDDRFCERSFGPLGTLTWRYETPAVAEKRKQISAKKH